MHSANQHGERGSLSENQRTTSSFSNAIGGDCFCRKMSLTANRKGSGSGKPELAQAGVRDNGNVTEALAKAEPWLEEKLRAN